MNENTAPSANRWAAAARVFGTILLITLIGPVVGLLLAIFGVVLAPPWTFLTGLLYVPLACLALPIGLAALALGKISGRWLALALGGAALAGLMYLTLIGPWLPTGMTTCEPAPATPPQVRYTCVSSSSDDPDYSYEFGLQGLAGWPLIRMAPTTPTPTPTPVSARNTPQIFSTAAAQTPLPADVMWLALLKKQPYPYATPLPSGVETALDGIYVKNEPKTGTPVPCRRCPDYLIEGGWWKLSLDKGAYHIFHTETRWGGLGSYSISGNRLYLFNDPTCFEETGIYEWKTVPGGIKLAQITDSCQVGRRAQNFSQLVWQSCRPPNREAAITGHWPSPAGCDN